MSAMIDSTPIAEIGEIVATLPLDAQREVLRFAQFVQAKLADAAWDAALEGTTDEQAARINVRIDSQRSQWSPLFDDAGKLAAPKLP